MLLNYVLIVTALILVVVAFVSESNEDVKKPVKNTVYLLINSAKFNGTLPQWELVDYANDYEHAREKKRFLQNRCNINESVGIVAVPATAGFCLNADKAVKEIYSERLSKCMQNRTAYNEYLF